MRPPVWIFAGLAGPAVYVLAVLLGPWLWPQYRSMAQPVSDLIASQAPTKSLLDPLFLAYNALTIVFAWGLRRSLPAASLGRYGATTLLLEGGAGCLTLLFPEGAGGLGSEIGVTGWLHISFAGLSSLASIASMLVLGLWMRRTDGWRGLGVFSLVSTAFVMVTGGLAAWSVATHQAWGGLAERLTIGGFLLWMFVLAWAVRKHYG